MTTVMRLGCNARLNGLRFRLTGQNNSEHTRLTSNAALSDLLVRAMHASKSSRMRAINKNNGGSNVMQGI
jgi:hypothetical protein